MSLHEQIARQLKDGPRWARSFQAAKGAVHSMVRANLVARVKPANGNANNMVALTHEGAARFFPGERIEGLATSHGQLRDTLADLIANGSSMHAAAGRMGIPRAQARSLWIEIIEGLGWQAR